MHDCAKIKGTVKKKNEDRVSNSNQAKQDPYISGAHTSLLKQAHAQIINGKSCHLLLCFIPELNLILKIANELGAAIISMYSYGKRMVK